MNIAQRKLFSVIALLVIATSSHAVEGPPTSNGVISNPTLVANQDVAKAQAAGAISTFMTEVDVDIRPYLREGYNVITMNVINGGGAGYGRVYGVAYQQSEIDCNFPVTNQCAPYEAAR